jgi:FkbM family methyltransferase
MPTTWLGARLGFLLRRLARAGVRGPVDIELWGVRFRFFPRGNITEGRLLFMPRLWDREERDALARTARPGMVFVDVGANVGAYSWWVWSQLDGRCEILAIEPDPELAAGLRWHVEENRAEAFEVAETAVGAAAGEAVLRIHQGNRGQNTIDALRPFASEGVAGARTVPLAPLLDILVSHGIERIDALKIDIEGLEWDVLSAFFRDAPGSLRPALLITEHSGSEAHRELSALLFESGYRAKTRTKMNLILELDIADEEA